MRLCFLTLLCSWLVALTTCASASEPLVVIRAGTVITVSGETYSPGMVVIEDGKIRHAGAAITTPSSARVIAAERETVFPGLVLASTRFELADHPRSGNHADARVADDVRPQQIDFDALLAQGFVAASFVPPGTGVPGRAALYRTGGAAGVGLVSADGPLRITFDNPGRDKRELLGILRAAQKAVKDRDKAREEWDKQQEAARKKAEATPKPEPSGGSGAEPAVPPATPTGAPPAAKPPEAPAEFKPPEVSANLRPFMDLLDKKMAPLLVIELAGPSDFRHLEEIQQLFPELAGTLQLKRGIQVDYRYIAADLGKAKARVELQPLLDRVPNAAERFNLAAELAEAGCELVWLPVADEAEEFARFRGRVGDLVRAGLNRDAALKALTLHAARALGVDDRYGSIEKGKLADLVLLDGDPLDPATQVTRVLIGGEIAWKRSQP